MTPETTNPPSLLLPLALARPSALVVLPWPKSTVMLAIDILRSMHVVDVEPTRMVVAQEAAKAFLSQALLGGARGHVCALAGLA